jgi:hypothetical protein
MFNKRSLSQKVLIAYLNNPMNRTAVFEAPEGKALPNPSQSGESK